VYDTCLELVEHLAERLRRRRHHALEPARRRRRPGRRRPRSQWRARRPARGPPVHLRGSTAPRRRCSDEVPGLQTRSTAVRPAGRAARQRAAASTSADGAELHARPAEGPGARRGTSARKSPTASLSVREETRREAPPEQSAGGNPRDEGKTEGGRCRRLGTPTVARETIAQVLALMGVEPEWTDAGRVDDVEPIPLRRTRPAAHRRDDSSLRTVQDAFRSAASVVHDAVDAVVSPSRTAQGVHVKKLSRRTRTRSPSRTSRSQRPRRGIAYSPRARQLQGRGQVRPWTRVGSLRRPRGDVRQWGGYAMGSRGNVKQAHDAFEHRLRNVDATVKIEDTAEQDRFDSSDWYAFRRIHLATVAGRRRAKNPRDHVGDSTTPPTSTCTRTGRGRKEGDAARPQPSGSTA